MKGLNLLKKNIGDIYKRRAAQLYALSLFYAAKALNDLRTKQAQNKYWENQTFTAVDTVFSNAFRDDNAIGWFIAHAIEYGVYLELANDGQNQALRPTMLIFVQPFVDAARSLYKGK
jgi:hypothetical protein